MLITPAGFLAPMNLPCGAGKTNIHESPTFRTITSLFEWAVCSGSVSRIAARSFGHVFTMFEHHDRHNVFAVLEFDLVVFWNPVTPSRLQFPISRQPLAIYVECSLNGFGAFYVNSLCNYWANRRAPNNNSFAR